MKETKTILKGGRIYDGTASEPFVGDILFQGDRILEVASSIDDPGAEVIDISGLSISSGFFDAHSHNDWFAIKKQPIKYFEPFIRQGITSFITGNCGLSAVGFEPETRLRNQIAAINGLGHTNALDSRCAHRWLTGRLLRTRYLTGRIIWTYLAVMSLPLRLRW